MKRLCIVTHNMAGGGCERVIAQLANQFVAWGIGCTIVTEYACASFYPLDERVRLVPMLPGGACPSRSIPRAYLALRRLVRRERPDVVLAMPEKVNVWTVLFLLGSGVPVAVSERNDPRRHPESRVKRALRRLLYPFARGFIFQTEQAAAYFSRRIRARAAVLPNPLDAARLGPPWDGPREKRVAFVGRLERQKDVPLLLNAFARFHASHPDWTLDLYGDGSQRAALEAQAGALLPPGAVAFFGACPDVADRIRRAGLFALSSAFEGMPNALIEAMALGLPCVATDCPCGGPAALIEHGQNGLLAPVGDAEAFAAALSRLADDPALAAALGRRARDIATRLDVRRVAGEWRDYLASCCASR